jgi:hypothetical protein
MSELWGDGITQEVDSREGVTQVLAHGEPTPRMLAVNRLDDIVFRGDFAGRSLAPPFDDTSPE